MKKETIMDTYAIKQGYECWWELLHYCMKNGNVQYHIDKVTDLIQEELKKKVNVIALDNLELFNSEYEILSNAILNTEIL